MMKKTPIRTCVICREKQDKRQLIRIVNHSEEGVVVDLSGKMNGRGAYICKNPMCIEKKNARKALAVALKTEVTEDEWIKIKDQVQTM